jgi:RNA polymerase sigma factor (sigma-70 family)
MMTNHRPDCDCDPCLLIHMRSWDAAQRQRGWESWYRRDAPRLLHYLERACWQKNCPEYAEEFLQDAFVIGFENILSGRYDEFKAALRAYLHGIAKNLIREAVRRQQREAVSIDGLAEEDVSALGRMPENSLDMDDMLYLADLCRQLRAALEHLPCLQRSVVFALYVKGTSANEVAKEYNLSVENARVMAHRGVSTMKSYIANQHQIQLSAYAIRLGLETNLVLLEAGARWSCEQQVPFPLALHTIQ